MTEAPDRVWIQSDHIPDEVALNKWTTEPDADEAHLFTEYARADLSTYDAGFAAGIEAAARRCDKFLMEKTNLPVTDVVDTLEYIRALTPSLPAPVVPKVKPLVWDRGVAITPYGPWLVYKGFANKKGNWCVCLSGVIIAHAHSEGEAKAAAQADHEARVLSQIDMDPVTVQEAARLLCDAPELAAWWSDAGWADINALAEQEDGQ